MDNNTLVNFSEIVENLHEIDKTEPGKNVYNINLKNFNDGKDTIGLRCLNKMISIEPNDGRNYTMLGY